MDAIDHSYLNIVISPASCLNMPLTAVFRSEPHFTSPHSWQKHKVSDAFAFDRCLRRKGRSEVTHSWLSLVRFYKSLNNHDIRLEDFMRTNCLAHPDSASSLELSSIDFSSFLKGLIPDDLFSNKMTTFHLRLVLWPMVEPPQFAPSIGERQWTRFWRGDIPFKARDVRFRLLHKKISCRQTLHALLPTAFTGLLCSICSTTVEDIHHCLYSCHLKYPMWEYIWDIYFDWPFGVSDLCRALFSLQFSKVKPAYYKWSVFQMFACTIVSIWSAHWAQIFQDAPFEFASVLTTPFKHLSKLTEQG